MSAELLKAIEEDSLEHLKLLIEAGADVNMIYSNGLTALMKAAQKGSEGCVKFLIKAEADVNVQSEWGVTALIEAAMEGFEPGMNLLIGAGADVNIMDEDGYTPLMGAALSGSEDCVKLLIKAGVDIDVKDKMGWTALTWAACFSHVGCVKVLIDAGADVNVKDNFGVTALMMAAEDGSNVSERVHCKASMKSPRGISEEEDKDKILKEKELYEASVASVKLLIEAGLNMKVTSLDEALIEAAKKGCEEILKSPDLIRDPLCLMKISRKFIRGHIIKVKKVNLSGRVQDLPLTKVMKDYLEN